MLRDILNKYELDKSDLLYLMNLTDKDDLNMLYEKAYSIKEKFIGRKAYFRGLIEFSNVCIKDCYYCGIRKSSPQERFSMTKEEILSMAQWAYENEYGSVTLQSGERNDAEYVEFITEIIKDIKNLSDAKLGITLCLGEQSEETYQRWFDAGAHRYLLRIETTSKELYKRIHPNDELHSLQKRIDCLEALKKIGYQVGTGVMIGLPSQTEEDLVNDILFFKEKDIDMIGMGPYVVHKDTPMGIEVLTKNMDTEEEKAKRFELGIKMIAITRLYLKDVNIAATTALQALNPLGRELGLKAGANILMPIITLQEYRYGYQLYDNKPCIDDDQNHCKVCLTGRVLSVGDMVGFAEWGDSPHFKVKNNSK
ncbi:MAG: [FeFe] hydrogenase H-cluster radical SAM maturase HydE [Defluviitaleaceae bacterium]|nr:[FeFe] hydrogenase H-cluster radical SAM maturase HydE [Defluviitaleaceae bacterium]